eukprot:COSAG02_NODE_59575_length_274_cov_0.560000_1_plen_26_part_10
MPLSFLWAAIAPTVSQQQYEDRHCAG